MTNWAKVAAGIALLAGLVGWMSPGGQAEPAGDAAFRQFVEGVWVEAKAAGVSRGTFDRAFDGVKPDLSLPDLVLAGKRKGSTKGQAEFVKPPQAYVNKKQIEQLAVRGKAFMARYAGSLERIEREIGVERHIVMGIWGRETAFGTHKLRHYAIRALATQAYLGRRRDMFRSELVHALKMLQDGVIAIAAMRSSWAGALGLTQFMPSEFNRFAYDLDGDGKKDIWNSVADGLASAANQLKGKGWVSGLAWGYEVVLPAGVDCANEGPPGERQIAEWVRLGLKRADGKAFPAKALGQPAYMMSPGGTHGPIFLVTQNFKVIRLYNTSDLYALFVGHLADRIAGGGDFVARWKGIGQLPTADIAEAQQRLKGRGYQISVVDGFIGSNTRRQIGLYQRASGVSVDCWPSKRTLERLRQAG